jgi:HSP20 family molecular chaperone IbpA
MAYESMRHHSTRTTPHPPSPPSTTTTSTTSTPLAESRLVHIISAILDPHHAKPAHPHNHGHHRQHHFTPRFDLEEHAHTYEIIGDLPGADKADLVVSTLDDHTLEISGFVKRYPGAAATAAAAGREEEEESVQDQLPTLLSAEVVVAAQGAGKGDTGGNDALHHDSFVKVSHHEATANGQDKAQVAGPTEVSDAGELDGGVLTKTHGTHPEEEVGLTPPSVAKTAKPFATKFVISERQTGDFHRLFHFSTTIVEESVVAKFENGVLRVSILKGVERPRRTVDINWGGALLF